MMELCPNIDNDGGLLQVLKSEEMFPKMGNTRWKNMVDCMKAQSSDKWSQPLSVERVNELRFLLFLVGSPLMPLQVRPGPYVHRLPTESSTATYVVHQYITEMDELLLARRNSLRRRNFIWRRAMDSNQVVNRAAVVQPALNSLHSMCITGEIRITVNGGEKAVEGRFVLMQKDLDLWIFDLVVSGCKVKCGSNGKISWGHSSNPHAPIPNGPPRPLRRFFQGLDPRSTAKLFLGATCIGEKNINDEDCFILKLETDAAIRKAQNGLNHEIIHHTIWGYFGQRSYLLIQFEDKRLIRMRTKDGDDVFWEMSTESVMEDYRYVDGVKIAHSGTSRARVLRYGEKSESHKWETEEKWKINQVEFNVSGLTEDHFQPPLSLHASSNL